MAFLTLLARTHELERSADSPSRFRSTNNDLYAPSFLGVRRHRRRLRFAVAAIGQTGKGGLIPVFPKLATPMREFVQPNRQPARREPW